MNQILKLAGVAALGVGAVVAGRTLLLKPTPAKDTKIVPEESDRAVAYGEALARMVRDETVSFRGQEDRSKFYRFHETLADLFLRISSTGR